VQISSNQEKKEKKVQHAITVARETLLKGGSRLFNFQFGAQSNPHKILSDVIEVSFTYLSLLYNYYSLFFS
jgi:hypothetical protein